MSCLTGVESRSRCIFPPSSKWAPFPPFVTYVIAPLNGNSECLKHEVSFTLSFEIHPYDFIITPPHTPTATAATLTKQARLKAIISNLIWLSFWGLWSVSYSSHYAEPAKPFLNRRTLKALPRRVLLPWRKSDRAVRASRPWWEVMSGRGCSERRSV